MLKENVDSWAELPASVSVQILLVYEMDFILNYVGECSEFWKQPAHPAFLIIWEIAGSFLQHQRWDAFNAGHVNGRN